MQRREEEAGTQVMAPTECQDQGTRYCGTPRTAARHNHTSPQHGPRSWYSPVLYAGKHPMTSSVRTTPPRVIPDSQREQTPRRYRGAAEQGGRKRLGRSTRGERQTRIPWAGASARTSLPARVNPPAGGGADGCSYIMAVL